MGGKKNKIYFMTLVEKFEEDPQIKQSKEE